jgi:hypothetical protein
VDATRVEAILSAIPGVPSRFWVGCRRKDDADPARGEESGILGIGGSL